MIEGRISFEQARKLLSKGKLVRRAIWGTNVFIAEAYPKYEDGRVNSVVEFNRSFPNVSRCLNNFIVIKTDKNELTPYTLMTEDLMGRDWEEVAFPVMEVEEVVVPITLGSKECKGKVGSVLDYVFGRALGGEMGAGLGPGSGASVKAVEDEEVTEEEARTAWEKIPYDAKVKYFDDHDLKFHSRDTELLAPMSFKQANILIKGFGIDKIKEEKSLEQYPGCETARVESGSMTQEDIEESIRDLQKANGQLTERVAKLEKDLRGSASILETTTATAEQAMKRVNRVASASKRMY